MFNGKMKAVTFSFDDGVTQDVRMIELLNKYNMKATFNLNSELLGTGQTIIREGNRVSHYKLNPSQVREIYDGHEIAVHTLTHPNLTQLEDKDEIIRQVEKDRLNLCDLAGYEVVGMAYPGGGINNNDFVAEIIKNNTGVKYARATESSPTFDLQENLFRFRPGVYFVNFDEMMKKGEEFVNLTPQKPQIYYIWGHSYEMDYKSDAWFKFEEFLKFISNRNDIFYGTNKEVLL